METVGAVTARTIAFDGCLNFRDLGGYTTRDGRTVRWRHLFRSDSLHRMSAVDVDRLLGDLGVVTVVDLRTQAERDRGGPVAAATRPGVNAVHLPMIDEVYAERARNASRRDDLGEGYAALLELAGEPVAAMLRLLAGDAYPAVFFCAAGKDRTGVLAALLLALLGVGDDDVVADYALTDLVAPAIIERADRELPENFWVALPPEARRAPAHVMRSMLAALARRHGSAEGFAASLGIGPDDLDGVRRRLLTGPGGGSATP